MTEEKILHIAKKSAKMIDLPKRHPIKKYCEEMWWEIYGGILTILAKKGWCSFSPKKRYHIIAAQRKYGKL